MDIAVKIKDCSYSYGKGKKFEKVLDGINLTVPSGIIYALLGPSGCGKTTLLKIITAQLKGKGIKKVLLFGSQPGSQGSVIPGPGIGYMPQELALYEDLTSEETLRLFGRLNLVKEKVITQRISELFKVLKLSASIKNKLVKNLSGGQQRRISLATALLHNPPLLILDEPTVGVDPLLRKQIWSYLVDNTAKKQTTIIITTHYIEEAKDANIIGAMRMGRILVEAPPQLIMRSFQETSLENCFYKICCIDSSTPLTGDKENVEKITEQSGNFKKQHSGKQNKSLLHKLPTPPHSFYRVKQLVKRNFVLRWRNIPIVLFQIFIPLVSIVCYCTCVGQELSGVRVALINEEIQRNLSTQFINQLNTDIISYKYYDNFEDGINSVISSETRMALQFKPKFTECVLRRITLGLDADNETLICSSISAYLDYTNLQIYFTLYTALLDTIVTFYQKIFIDLGVSPMIATLPVDVSRNLRTINAYEYVKKHCRRRSFTYTNAIVISNSAGWIRLQFSQMVLGKELLSRTDYTIPGLFLMIVHFLGAGSIVFVIVNEKRNGLVDKLWTTSVTWSDLLISQVISEVIYTIIQSILLLIYFFYVYGLEPQGSPLLILILMVLQGCTGMALGIIWPLEGMSQTMRTFCRFLPLTQPAEAFKAILFRGWGLEQLTVLMGFVSTVVWFIIYFGLSLIILR